LQLYQHAPLHNSIIDASIYIRWGKAVFLSQAGPKPVINEPGIGGFNALQALSTNNAEFQSASRPFDKTRDGFVLGEAPDL